jgi:hypothetical protein
MYLIIRGWIISARPVNIDMNCSKFYDCIVNDDVLLKNEKTVEKYVVG